MKGLMVSTGYLDVRASRISHGLSIWGIRHEGLCFRIPPHMLDTYTDLKYHFTYTRETIQERVKDTDADVIHVHGELYGSWLIGAAKDATDKPVIFNVHDLVCARPESLFDPFEQEAFERADAFVWVTQEQRAFAIKVGLLTQDDLRPWCVVPNYASSRYQITRTGLPHIGGVCYSGGITKRGDDASDRDLSPVSDAVEAAGGQFHIYPGGPKPDYGTVHDTESVYPIYIERLAQHDWGFAGHPLPKESWLHSVPTKVTEYFMAGIPAVLLNVPVCNQFVDLGMAVGLDSVKDMRKVLRSDPKPYRKRVLENRDLFTTERSIDPLVDLYKQLVEGGNA